MIPPDLSDKVFPIYPHIWYHLTLVTMYSSSILTYDTTWPEWQYILVLYIVVVICCRPRQVSIPVASVYPLTPPLQSTTPIASAHHITVLEPVYKCSLASLYPHFTIIVSTCIIQHAHWYHMVSRLQSIYIVVLLQAAVSSNQPSVLKF